MIQSLKDYLYYLDADRLALGIRHRRPGRVDDEIWRFQIALRRYEYAVNCRRSPWFRLYRMWARARFHAWSVRLGFSIPPNVFGPGLSIAHRGTIVVHNKARVGKNCRIHVCVVIGTAAGTTDRVATLGDNIYIGPGAKIFGPITLADNIAIGANSVVNKSFVEPAVTIAGAPARVISHKGSEGLVIKGADLVPSPAHS